jgi:hypothetical protein
VGLFLGRTEFVGGRADGGSRNADFEFDLRGIVDQFESVERFSWTAVVDANSEAPHAPGFITIRGLVESNAVRLRIYAVPPTDAGPAFRELPNGERTPS